MWKSNETCACDTDASVSSNAEIGSAQSIRLMLNVGCNTQAKTGTHGFPLAAEPLHVSPTHEPAQDLHRSCPGRPLAGARIFCCEDRS